MDSGEDREFQGEKQQGRESEDGEWALEIGLYMG